MPDVIDSADLYLDELARLGLTLARELHTRACAEEDPEVCARLAQAFHTVSRGVRQSLALQQRLARGRLRAEAERREETRQAREVRKASVRAAVTRLAWTEKPDWNEHELRGRINAILDTESETETFLQDPAETQVARISERLGMSASMALLVPANAGLRPKPSKAAPGRGRADGSLAALNSS